MCIKVLFVFVFNGSIKKISTIICFSLLVGQGAHEYAIQNNITVIDPINLISGIIFFFLEFLFYCTRFIVTFMGT